MPSSFADSSLRNVARRAYGRVRELLAARLSLPSTADEARVLDGRDLARLLVAVHEPSITEPGEMHPGLAD